MAAQAPYAAELVGITKRFGPVVANDGVDLAIAPGEVHAVVGENGAGKSTLMSILFGLHRPDAGRVLIAGVPARLRSPADAIAHGLGMVHQRFRLFPGLTVAENVVIGAEPVRRGLALDQAAARRRVADLGERYGLRVDPAARVGDLPVGVRQRVEILKALHREARILILDEPTAVLTPGESERLFAVLRTVTGTGASVVLVTHRLGEVLAASDRVTVLRRGRVTGRFATAETTADELVRAMIGRSVAAPAGRASAVDAAAPYALEVRGLTVRDADGVTRLADVSLGVRPGEIVGVAGVAGSGQRELVDQVVGLGGLPERGVVRLLGAELTAADTVRRRREAGIAYVPEDRHGRAVAAEMTLAENLVMGDQRSPGLRGRFGLSAAKVRARARSLVERFAVRTPSVDAPVSALSGGNAQKAVLARELSRGTPVIVVEEPTQGVDVGAQEQIHALLTRAAEEGRAILLVSSELAELRALADRVHVLYAGRVTAELTRDEATEAAIGEAMTGTTTDTGHRTGAATIKDGP
ncbi:ABC transporter ATP-binding protein [Thermopolyspora sp. NPDC052614]|uniref:ABC transporter ATP-binding protein n=1 Tax=Thermopolyspora sp. NPDC052614 TaxID=3155682 RepID=UPI003443603A